MTICNLFRKIRFSFERPKFDWLKSSDNQENDDNKQCQISDHDSDSLFEIIDFEHVKDWNEDSVIHHVGNRKHLNLQFTCQDDSCCDSPNSRVSSVQSIKSIISDHIGQNRYYANNQLSTDASCCSCQINAHGFNENHSYSIAINGQLYHNVNESDFSFVKQLGSGNYGYVQKYQFLRTEPNTQLAIKRVKFDSSSEHNVKHALKDIDLLSCCFHENIIQLFGYMVSEHYTEIWICMELMDICFDAIIKHFNAINQTIPEYVIGSVAVSTINALCYLKKTFSIMHRDIKPSNILINNQGMIKLCDFGVFGRLVDSVSSSQTMGTLAYQAPERLMVMTSDCGKLMKYDHRADVWSLGLSLLEMAVGRMPYDKCNGTFAMVTMIVDKHFAPILNLDDHGHYSLQMKQFIDACLKHDYRVRATYDSLMNMDFFMIHHHNPSSQTSLRTWFKQYHNVFNG